MKIAAWIMGIAAAFLLAGLAFCEVMIGWGVEGQSRKAMARFQGDRIEALIAFVGCESCSLGDRNHAVWALGQLRDKRALPILYKYRTGKPCDHMRLICQYEIAKAVRWTEGKSYMFPQMWRVMLSKNPSASAKMHT